MTDTEYLTVQAKSDDAAMGRLISRLLRLIESWARREKGRQPDNELCMDDLVSVGLMEIPKAVRCWAPERGRTFLSFLALVVHRRWLCRFPREVSLKRRGKQSRRFRPKLFDGEGRLDDKIIDLRDEFAVNSVRAQVKEILEKIPFPLALVIRRAYGIGVEQMTLREMAAADGVSHGAEHLRLKKALSRFREFWESDLPVARIARASLTGAT